MTVPQAHDIERAVLSSVLFEPEHVQTVVDSGGEALFYSPRHRLIWLAMDTLHGKELGIDQLSVAEELRRSGDLDRAGGEQVLAELMGEITPSAAITSHCKMLQEKAYLRGVIQVASAVQTLAEMEQHPAERLESKFAEGIQEIRERLQIREQDSLSGRIRKWVEATSGDFLATDCDKELNLATPGDKKNRAKVLERLCREGIIERLGSRRGSYRTVNSDLEIIDYKTGTKERVLELSFPLGIHELVKLHRKNIVIVAGESNSGKTAFLLDFIRLNMTQHRIRYFNSEMGPEEFQTRLKCFEIPLSEWNFSAYSRTGDFQDVIDPDGLNVIDFLERYDEFYKIGEDIRRIFDRLENGLAVIAIQKNPGQAFGIGGARSIEKARLYVGMEPGKITLEKAKDWRLSDVNPNKLERTFKLVKGSRFIPTSEWAKGKPKGGRS